MMLIPRTEARTEANYNIEKADHLFLFEIFYWSSCAAL